jgi:hypothetical protein
MKLFIGVLPNIITAVAWHLPEGKRLESCCNHSTDFVVDNSDRRGSGRKTFLSQFAYVYFHLLSEGGRGGIGVPERQRGAAPADLLKPR